MLTNLCGNAIKFAPPGGEVTLGATADAAAVHVAVRDSGPGVPEADLRHMFESYWRADGGPARAGLASSK